MIMKENRVIEQQQSRFLETLGSSYPWLVYPHSEDSCRQTFCTISHPFKSYGKTTSKLRNIDHLKVLGHSYGWLIISSKISIIKPEIHRLFIVLWNPVSLELINLPPLDLKPGQDIYSAYLLSPPSNPDSVVLVFERIVKSFILCKIGDHKKWTKIAAKEIDLEMQIKDYAPSNSSRYLDCCPVNYKGRCYAAMYSKLKVIDHVKPKHIMFRSLNCQLPALRLRNSNCYMTRLVESCGELCVIQITKGGLNYRQVLDIDIFSLDSITMEWNQLTSSKDRAFFFSMDTTYAISCAANGLGIKGGFVYYTSGTDKILYSFNLEDRSISICLPCKNISPKSKPFWFMPDLSIINQIINREEKQTGTEQNKGKHLLKFSPDKRNISDLPFDIIAVIAENLYSLPPWLMFADKANGRTLHTFVDPMLGGRYTMNIPEFIIDYDILYSKEGWLLMSPKVNGDSMFLYNPFIGRHISFPSPTDKNPIYSFGFSSSPTSSSCIIVGISLRFISCFNLRKDEVWYEEWRNDGPSHFSPTHSSPVFFEGVFYFLGQQGNLGVFSVEEFDDYFQSDWEFLENPTKPCDSFDHSYLLECDGNLFAVFVDNLGESIGVFVLNRNTMAWRKVSDIGNYMFFLSPSSSFSMVAQTPGMENKIYFPKIKGKEIVYYCLRTGKYRTFGSKQVAANFYNTKEYLFSSWIQQSWLHPSDLLHSTS